MARDQDGWRNFSLSQWCSPERAECKHRLSSLSTGLIVPCLCNLLSRIILLTLRFVANIPSKDSLSEIFWPDNLIWRWTQMAARTSELQRARHLQWDAFYPYSSSSKTSPSLKQCSIWWPRLSTIRETRFCQDSNALSKVSWQSFDQRETITRFKPRIVSACLSNKTHLKISFTQKSIEASSGELPIQGSAGVNLKGTVMRCYWVSVSGGKSWKTTLCSSTGYNLERGPSGTVVSGNFRCSRHCWFSAPGSMKRSMVTSRLQTPSKNMTPFGWETFQNSVQLSSARSPFSS